MILDEYKTKLKVNDQKDMLNLTEYEKLVLKS